MTYTRTIEARSQRPLRTITHDSALDQIVRLRESISPQQIGDAFIYSLTSGRIALRSGLGSYAVALRMPAHQFASSSGERRCQVCGGYDTVALDLNVLNFERHKWGGVRHSQPSYIAFDLERFIAESHNTSRDLDSRLLRSLVATIESMDVGAKLSDLVRALKTVASANDAQRRTVIAILGYAGIVRIPDRPGFFKSFTRVADREQTPWHKNDWPYPIQWWKGGQGIDPEAMQFWFGQSCN